jgi:phospholipase/carboxylesterase
MSTLAALGCGDGGPGIFAQSGGGNARLNARPGTPATVSPAGTYAITASNPNDGVLVIPTGVSPSASLPLIVALHGAGMGSGSARALLETQAQTRGFALLAPGARGLTWDVFSYKFSYDVTFIDATLAWVFAQCRIDPARVTVQGFSDGASYALGLGLANGDLFSRVVANSPGLVPRSDTPPTGKPQFWFSHGKQDPILQIDGASRSIVPALRKNGYDVTFVEFDGGHEVPPAILQQSLDWALR